jgi:hypothetical protein
MELGERSLPDWINGFMTLTEETEPPRLFRKWSAISCIAAALQRKCRIELGVSLTFYPNMYIVLVGPSATGKGTAMAFASDIINQVPNIKLASQATSLQALIRRMKETNFIDIDEENNTTMYHSSMTIFSNEFTVFLGYHNRELISALCDWYDCHNVWTYDTISRDKETINGVWVNLLAGTTPDSIQSALPQEAIGAGLTSRIIFVNEYKKDKLIIIPSSIVEGTKVQQMLINDLAHIQLMSGKFKLAPSFIEYYTEWCYKQDEMPPFYDKKFDGYNGRRRRHLMALSMVCSASCSDSMDITSEHVQRAAELLEEVELKMSTVFRGLGRSDIADLINDAIRFIETSSVDEIPLWQFARAFEGNMDKISMDRVLKTLEASRYVQLINRPGIGMSIVIIRQ